MRVLAFDPGADRMGYALLETGPKEITSGIESHPSSGIKGVEKLEGETYQDHKLRIIEYWAHTSNDLIKFFKPDIIANEIVPPTGGNVGNVIHRQKAMTAITAVQVVAIQSGIKIKQIAASTVKKNIGGSGTATKVAVRNGVIELLPSTERFKPEWKKVFDHSDAFAVGLTALGYKIEKRTK
jgi:Holliday junction resolvasome RuvABC endonuclease subunit